MKALITGASSGLGRDMARELAKRGIELIIIARRRERLEELARNLPVSCRIICLDLRSTEECHSLYLKVKDENIDILINNAGFGLFGEFYGTDLDRELDMIDLNIKAVHTLTKLFLRDFKERGTGYILNVASAAAFLPGPLMSCYYATKAYVLRLSDAIHEELRRGKSSVYIGTFCPGPVDTEFNERADVRCAVKGLSSPWAARYAIDKMFEKKRVIIPGASIRFASFMARFIPSAMLLKISYHLQKRKRGD